MAQQIKIDGGIAKIGDFVGFKSDIEQSGKLKAINGNELMISVYDSVSGERYDVHHNARRCWLE